MRNAFISTVLAGFAFLCSFIFKADSTILVDTNQLILICFAMLSVQILDIKDKIK